MYRNKTKTGLGLTAAGLSAILALSGCSASTEPDSGSSGPASQEDFDAAMSKETELTFWSWVPDIENEVALFEAEYPAIKVTVENAGQGDEQYTKLRTALEAGKGAPDVVMMGYEYTSSFILTDSLLDLAPYGAAEVKDDYVPWVWNQVARGDAVYGIPQDSGPMGNLYREDLMTAAGVTEAPATWDDYAAAAAQLKDSSGAYISNLSPSDVGVIISLLWQAGVKPFGYDGDKTVKVDINGDDSKAVMAYWQDLIQKDLVSVDPSFTDEWYQGLATGKYAGWLTAAWAPVFLNGIAADTAGQWRAAPMPQWNAGDNASGNWGGVSNAVVATTENPIASYELARFINNEIEPATMFANEQSLFPTLKTVLEDPAFIEKEDAFYGGQKVNKLFAEISETVDTEFEWLPYADVVASSFQDTLGKAIAEKGDLSAGLDAWQEALVDYGTAQGFTVN